MKTIELVELLNRGVSRSRLLARTLRMLAASVLAAQQAEAQSLTWASSYCGIAASAVEEVEGVVADNSGNVFVTGLSGAKGIGSGIRTMKLDARGSVLWNVIHSRPALCGGMWGRTPLALDADGNLIVVGAEFTSGMDNWNPLLLKLNPLSGAVLSRLVFDLGPCASFDAVAVDGSDIYILAHNNPNNGNPHIVRTLKLGPAGTALWCDSFAPETFWGTAGGIAATGAGICTAAGGKVIARDLNGAVIWESDLMMPNGGSALAPDGAGNVYLAVQSGVAKFDLDGNLLGVISGISSQVSGLDVDAAGNIYLVGSTVGTSSRGSDIITQKYTAAGKLLWSSTYGKNGGYSDNGIAITARGGYVYVGGSKYNKNLDMCTLKYTAGN